DNDETGLKTSQRLSQQLKRLNIENYIKTIPDADCKDADKICEFWTVSKMHQLPFPTSTTIYTKPLELVHIDIWEPAPFTSKNGYKYYISIMDAYSRYVCMFLLTQKS
ncbi:MAG: hypothetical protein Q8875_03015, partial [Pigeon pea little leaf phytoplasma]|nr:hypothetical protein [Pigeon pea little leaf phytoplasma]